MDNERHALDNAPCTGQCREANYWRERAQALEDRNDQLVDEILHLKGRRWLTPEEIREWNERVERIKT